MLYILSKQPIITLFFIIGIKKNKIFIKNAQNIIV